MGNQYYIERGISSMLWMCCHFSVYMCLPIWPINYPWGLQVFFSEVHNNKRNKSSRLTSKGNGPDSGNHQSHLGVGQGIRRMSIGDWLPPIQSNHCDGESRHQNIGTCNNTIQLSECHKTIEKYYLEWREPICRQKLQNATNHHTKY